MEQFGLVEAIDRLGQRVVVAVTPAADGVVNQTTVLVEPTIVQGLLKRVEFEYRE